MTLTSLVFFRYFVALCTTAVIQAVHGWELYDFIGRCVVTIIVVALSFRLEKWLRSSP